MTRTRNTTRLRARLVVFAGVSLLLLGANAQATCYNTWGEEDTNQQPCSAPGADAGAVTWCCKQGDTCLSNGLCLSPESSNLMTQQGCTKKNWDGCTTYCQASSNRPELPNAIPLIPCPATLNPSTNTIQHCCGNADDLASCCSSTNSAVRHNLPLGTILPSSQESESSSSSSTSSATSYSLKIGLGIGLGIGIPILLVLLAVAYLLAQPMHARRKKRKERLLREQQRGGGGSGGRKRKAAGTMTEKTSDTSHTYPPPRSFGRVDTRTNGGSSEFGGDEEGGIGRGAHHAWPPMPIHGLGVNGSGGGDGAGGPASASSVATAIAQWARSPFGFGGMEPPPPSPKEMDASSNSGGGRRGGWRGTTSRLGAAELPSPDPNMGGGGSSAGRESGVRGWKEGRHVHVATEVELPSPDTPERDVERGLGGRI